MRRPRAGRLRGRPRSAFLFFWWGSEALFDVGVSVEGDSGGKRRSGVVALKCLRICL